MWPASSSRVAGSSTAPPPSASTPVVLGRAPSATAVALQRRGSLPRRTPRRCRRPSGPRRRLDVGVGVADRHAPGARRAARPRWSCRRPSGRPARPAAPSPPVTGTSGCRGSSRRCGGSRATESPPNFSSTASASTSATIASATIPAAGTAQTSERWWCATASSPVATSTVRSARGTVAIGFIAARTRSTSPVVMPPSVPPERPDVAGCRRRSGTISSWACEPGVAASSKPSPTSTPLIAWMPISAPASRESRRRSQCTCEPRPGRQAVHDDLDHAAERVAVLVRLVDRARPSPRSPRGRGSGPGRRRAGRRRRARAQSRPGARTPPSSTTWETIRAPDGLLEEVRGDPAQRDPGGGLARRGPLEHRAGLVEAVLLHAGQVGVAGPRAGSAAALRASASSSTRVDRVGRHHLLPLGPLGVADLDRDRAAHGSRRAARRRRWSTSSCSNFIRAPRP